MNKTKPQRPILKIVPLSPWINKTVNGVQYWVHVPSRKGGIHIRGLAALCGVPHRLIRSAIQNAKKVKGEVGQNYKTELYNLLKDKTIFLEELGQNLPKLRGGAHKIICSDVCAIFIRYYAGKKYEKAMESALAFMDFGIEQFIFIKVGFIPRPESIMLNNIEFLIAKETVQVNKSRQEEARFFTNPITGECGIALQSLGFLCGGVAIKHIETFLQAHNEPFLEPQQPEKIVKAPLCAAVLQYFGYDNKPRKTVAQHWLQTLEPLVPTLHKKTNYQATPPTDNEAQMEQQISELKNEVARLRQLVKNNEVQGNIQWHKIMSQLLQKSVPNDFFEIRTEAETSQVTQWLDVLILKRPHPLSEPVEDTLLQNLVLPDGLSLTKEINLLTYKSHQESLTLWAVQELIGHYVGYRKILAAQDYNHILPKPEQFQLYAVTTLFPQMLVTQVGISWQLTDKKGVYRLFGFGLEIVVIVTREIPAAPHNVPWNLLSHDPELIRYALAQEPLPEDLLRYFDTTTLSC